MPSGFGQLPEDVPAERRANVRYPFALELRYTTSRRHSPLKTGTGRTIDLSSSGLRFIADRALPAGQVIEVYIDWPALLDGGVRLQLIIWGSVIRANGTEIALQIQKHGFRTRGGGQQSPEESVG